VFNIKLFVMTDFYDGHSLMTNFLWVLLDFLNFFTGIRLFKLHF
jgi:hypothetical protein